MAAVPAFRVQREIRAVRTQHVLEKGKAAAAVGAAVLGDGGNRQGPRRAMDKHFVNSKCAHDSRLGGPTDKIGARPRRGADPPLALSAILWINRAFGCILRADPTQFLQDEVAVMGAAGAPTGEPGSRGLALALAGDRRVIVRIPKAEIHGYLVAITHDRARVLWSSSTGKIRQREFPLEGVALPSDAHPWHGTPVATHRIPVPPQPRRRAEHHQPVHHHEHAHGAANAGAPPVSFVHPTPLR